MKTSTLLKMVLLLSTLSTTAFSDLTSIRTRNMVLKNVFGKDNRVKVDRKEFKPANAVGYLAELDNNNATVASCTATLVARDLILTNAHCMDNTANMGKYRFYLNYENHRADVGAKIIAVTRVNGDYLVNDGRDDWAIMRIDQPLGDTYGYLNINSNPIDFNSTPIILIGYPDDFFKGQVLSMSPRCFIKKETQDEVYYHDCPMSFGASGSPMIIKNGENYEIVAINEGEYLPEVRHYFLMSQVPKTLSNLPALILSNGKLYESIYRNNRIETYELKTFDLLNSPLKNINFNSNQKVTLDNSQSAFMTSIGAKTPGVGGPTVYMSSYSETFTNIAVKASRFHYKVEQLKLRKI